MHRTSGTWPIVVGATLWIGFATLSLSTVRAGERPWMPQDSITVRYVSTVPGYVIGWGGGTEHVTPSPDGEYFFFLTHRGEIESDAIVVELNVYATREVKAWLARQAPNTAAAVPLRPYRQLVFRSEKRELPIQDAQWDVDGYKIVFLGITEQGVKQARRFDIRSGDLEKLTSTPNGVSAFLMRGKTVIFDEVTRVWFTPSYPVTVFQHVKSPEGLTPYLKSEGPRDVTRSYAILQGGTPRLLSGNFDDVNYRSEWISPDGRFAVGLYMPQGFGSRSFRERKPLQEYNGLQFVVADLRTGRVVSMMNAPVGVVPVGTWLKTDPQSQIGPEAYWSADGTRVGLFPTALPSSSTPSAARAAHAGARSFLVEYEPTTRKWKVLEPAWLPNSDPDVAPQRFVTQIGWLEEGRTLLVNHHVDGKPGDAIVYSFERSGLVGRTADPSVTLPEVRERKLDGLSVLLRQGPNEPPQLVASDGDHEANLLGPDPTIDNVWLARTERFQWQEPEGPALSGELTLPRWFTKGKRVPLVVHIQNDLPEWFLPDGESKTPSEARQALAARGMAVLGIGITEDDLPIDPDRFIARLDAAVDALVRDGIADPERIGVTGFSQGGYQVYYAITHPGRTRIAAAICADSWKGDYASYLFAGASGGTFGGTLRSFEQGLGGGKPYWENKAAWDERETSFNVHRVRGATMFTLHGRLTYSYLDEMQTIGAFLLNKKPVEYLFFPEGKHQLERPLERLAMMEATVDWMAFWLQGFEDPAPHKAAQYARWRSSADPSGNYSVTR